MRTPLENLGAWITRRVSGASAPDVSLGTRIAGEDIDSDTLRVAPTGRPSRYLNTTAQQVVKNSPGHLYAILVEASPASASTIQIHNSTQLVFTLNIPANTTWARYDLGFLCDTDIRVTPSSTSLTFTVVWS